MKQKNCKNCGLPLVRGANCKSLLANYCNNPECQEKRLAVLREQRLAASRRQSKRLHEDRFCLNCGALLIKGKNVKGNAAKWCDRSECQREKRNWQKEKYEQQRLNSYVENKFKTDDLIEQNSNWTYFKSGKCEFCGEEKPLNRFGVCNFCYSYRSKNFELEEFCVTGVNLEF